MAPHPAQARRSHRRSGFTLIELLIVLAIISILLSIAWASYGVAVENARISATRATIRQLDSALQERVTAFHRVNLKSQAQQFTLGYNAAGSNTPVAITPQFSAISEIIVRKDRFRAAFPQRKEDLYGIDGTTAAPNAPLYQYWTPGASHTPETESSELLYLALTKGSVFGQTPLNIDRIRPSHIGDTDNDGMLEFLDEFGKPLRFYNWTTRLIRPAGNGQPIDRAMFLRSAAVLMPGAPVPSATPLAFDLYSDRLNQDPDDPTGALSNAMGAPFNYFAGATFDAVGIGAGCPTFNEENYHALDTYSLPLIVSGGSDLQVGLYEPDGRDPRTPSVAPTAAEFPRRLAMPLATGASDSTNLDLLYDNITNRQP